MPMPADSNPPERVALSKSLLRDRELEIKRAKGEASCAECRRLKLKCDRKTPCASCVRRGCQTICPNGCLATGQGTRFVLANTDKLHEKLLQMSRRIRQLEDALHIVQASLTPASHPLLSEDLLAIKAGVDGMFEKDDLTGHEDDLADVSSSELGMLSISERGETCFMGRSSSEALLMAIKGSLVDQPAKEEVLCDLRRTSHGFARQTLSIGDDFPLASSHLPKAETLNLVEAHLPSYARATALVEAYLANIAWSSAIVDREQIFEEIIPSVYNHSRRPAVSVDDEDECEYLHRLALLLTVFANGAAGDLTLPVANDEAEEYIRLARATLSLTSIFTGASLENVQTVFVLAMYDFCSSRKYTLEPSWKMMYFGLTLASSIGLHRDPERWKMEPKLVQRRRRLFWEIFSIDKGKSLESGRPAMFNLSEIDCNFPDDKNRDLNEDDSVTPSFWLWKYRFAKEVLAPIAEQLCQTRPIKYHEVLELDRKLRDFEAHPSVMARKNSGADENITIAMRRYHWSALREIALLYVHRSFFAKVMLDTPTRPLYSPFASSLLAAYASAISLLKILRNNFENYSYLLLRQWSIWAHGLTSAVIVGSVACRGPASSIAPAALIELEEAVNLFKKAQIHPVPRRALSFLLRLLEKARSANHPTSLSNELIARQELSILRGTPFLLDNGSRSSPSSSCETSPSTLKPNMSISTKTVVQPFPLSTVPGPPASGHLQSQSADLNGTQQSQRQTSSTVLNRSYHSSVNDASTSHIWPFASPDSSAPQYLSDSSSQTNVPTQPYHHAPELISTSWLEEISNSLPSRTAGQRPGHVDSSMDLDFLMGEGSSGIFPGGFPYPEQGDDPVIVEAWRSLMTDSQAFGPEVASNLY